MRGHQAGPVTINSSQLAGNTDLPATERAAVLVVKSARRLAQSKNWRTDPARGGTRSLVECGSPLPLSTSMAQQLRNGDFLAIDSVINRGNRQEKPQVAMP